VKGSSFLALLKHGDVEKLPSEKDFEALVSLRYQEKLNTSLKEMYKVELRGMYKTTAKPIQSLLLTE